jgi:hypothetical protein
MVIIGIVIHDYINIYFSFVKLKWRNQINIEGMMIAAGQNLKRLIKHNLEKPGNFLRIIVFPLLPKRPVTFSIAWIVMRRGPDL